MKDRLAPGSAGAQGKSRRRTEKVELPPSPRGNCYVTAEALFHLLGGKQAGWKPMCVRHRGDTHWFLQHETGMIVDPVARGLWAKHEWPDYSKARGKGFLTANPSERAIQMMLAMSYGIPFATNHEMNAEYHRGLRAGLSGGVRG